MDRGEAQSKNVVVSVVVPAEAKSPRKARRALRAIRDSFDPIAFVDLQWIVSELIIDAIHGDSKAQIGVQGELHEDSVRVEMVADDESYRIRSQRPELGEPGWGFQLMRRLASRWDLAREPAMARLWFELPLGLSTGRGSRES